MRFLVRIFQAILVIIGIGVLHYTLPQNDVVRINDTYEKRIDFALRRFDASACKFDVSNLK